MVRLIRLATAALLVLGTTAAPLVLEHCAIACEAGQATASSGGPTCHHLAATTTRLSDNAPPCGHDHHPVFVDTASAPGGPTRVLTPAWLGESPSLAGPPPGPLVSLRAADIVGSPPITLRLSAILRI